MNKVTNDSEINSYNYDKLFLEIDKRLKDNQSINIAIEGNSSGGKSYLSQLIKDKYKECNVFHMDDFFLLPEQRTKERLSEIGGNIDYIRFNEQVIKNLIKGETFHYEKYSCKSNEMIRSEEILPKPINIIEGVYCLHPLFKDIYDFKIFLSVDYETQCKRILKRNGEKMLERYKKEWIPLENKYFDKMNILQEVNLIIQTSKMFE